MLALVLGDKGGLLHPTPARSYQQVRVNVVILDCCNSYFSPSGKNRSPLLADTSWLRQAESRSRLAIGQQHLLVISQEIFRSVASSVQGEIENVIRMGLVPDIHPWREAIASTLIWLIVFASRAGVRKSRAFRVPRSEVAPQPAISVSLDCGPQEVLP
jgi:hypothetical protein